MSREILFRGKRIDNGEWVEGYLVKYPSGKTEIHKKCIEPPDILLVVEVDPKTICQYTGMTEKFIDLNTECKKIFENDIVKVRKRYIWHQMVEGFIGCVQFERGTYCIKVQGEFCGQSLFGYIDDLDIIGNIFDNPELIH